MKEKIRNFWMNKNLFTKYGYAALLVLTICFFFTIQGLAQSTNITGDEEFFFKRREKPNINFGFDLLLSQTAQYYSKLLFSTVENEMFQVGFSLRGYFPITNKFNTRILLPYYYKAGISGDDEYPNSAEVFPGLSDYQKNYGWGDLSAELTYDVLYMPINLIVQLGAVVATGESRFDKKYDGYLPLGNGFHALSFGGGISRRLSYETLLFASGGYVLRFPREFEPTEYNNGLLLNGSEYKPGDIYFLRAGIGFFIGLFSKHKRVFNLEAEYIRVGATKLNDSSFEKQPIVESPFDVLRVGLKAVLHREQGVSTSIFLGVENRNYDGTQTLLPVKDNCNTFLVIANIPMFLKILNFNL